MIGYKNGAWTCTGVSDTKDILEDRETCISNEKSSLGSWHGALLAKLDIPDLVSLTI